MRKYEMVEATRLLYECLSILHRYENSERWHSAYLAVQNAYDVLIDSERRLYEDNN